jgi:RNA polymerase sigma factor (TIGR02999 family)
MLQAAGRGDAQAAADLLPLVYGELRKLADSWMAKLAPGQTLQPTALVHEAYLRLVRWEDSGWESRRHFFFAAARAMHDILVEQARRKASLKRGGGRERLNPDGLVVAIETPAEDMLALSEALEQLERHDSRKHQIVLLRFFAGLTEREVSEVMNISLRTVEREWRYIRAKLHKELAEPEGNSG